MKQIVIKDIDFIKKVEEAPLDFEINPLDINLAQIQLNFINKIKNITQESFDLSEAYVSKNPLLNISEIKIYTIKDGGKISLKLVVTDKLETKAFIYNILTDTKENIIDFICSKDFVRINKNVIKEIDTKYL